jgi:glutaredoxin-like protein
MSLLPEKVRQQIEKRLTDLKEPIKLVVFTQEFECPTCEENRTLMEDVARTVPEVSVEVNDFVLDKDVGDAYKIDKIPATVVEGKKDCGIRFYGIPNGYELSSLVEAIKMVSLGDSMLSAQTREQIKALSKPVTIQVFITPTCPYCATAVQMAHKMALESELITADMVEIVEFPYLTQKYNVFAVPKVVMNEKITFEGALHESKFLKRVMKAGK